MLICSLLGSLTSGHFTASVRGATNRVDVLSIWVGVFDDFLRQGLTLEGPLPPRRVFAVDKTLHTRGIVVSLEFADQVFAFGDSNARTLARERGSLFDPKQTRSSVVCARLAELYLFLYICCLFIEGLVHERAGRTLKARIPYFSPNIAFILLAFF